MIGEAEKDTLPEAGHSAIERNGCLSPPIWRVRAITGLVSVPNHCMHSPYEVISLWYLESTGLLIAETVRALGKSNLGHTVEVFRRRS